MNDEPDRIEPPAALVLGCNTPHGIGVLSDWIEEQTGHPPDFTTMNYPTTIWDDKGSNSGNGYEHGTESGSGWGCGVFAIAGNGTGDGTGYGGNGGDGTGCGGDMYPHIYGTIDGNGYGDGTGLQVAADEDDYYDDEDYEADYDDLDYDRETCWHCHGDGGFHDCGDDVCPCADPEPNEICRECDGTGRI